MENKSKKMFLITGVLFLLFVVFTVMVSLVDVQPIGPEQSEIGLATLNQFVFTHLGVHPLWDTVTDWLGIVAILVVIGFALFGFVQLLRRKSVWKVDMQILLLGVFYGLVAFTYVLFECVVINYRPILLEGSLEASYPSSHTMMVICVMTTAMILFRRIFADKKPLRIALELGYLLVLVITPIGRLLAGVHWFTDIVGGILLSSALVMLYVSMVQFFAEKQNEEKCL